MTYVDDARQALQDELNARGVLFDDSRLLDLYTLLVMSCGQLTDVEEVHDAWAVATARTHPNHRSLVEFEDLAEDVQALDAPYRDAIRAAADRLERPGYTDGPRAIVRTTITRPDTGEVIADSTQDVILGAGPLSRQIDLSAELPRLLRRAADDLSSGHEPTAPRRTDA